MVRAPCCEKMGLKKGPWTAGEDHVLVSYIQRFGHGNWRALPKQAGLLRCGKSCRLRWINYLRPDIKRGNFSKEEEDTIVDLHRALGNRWSAIAAKLPGRTDNEIKNVWHTYLKKRVNSNDVVKEPKKKTRTKTASEDNKPITLKREQECTKAHALLEASSNVSVPSPSESYNSDLSSTVAESSSHVFDDSNNGVTQEEWMHPSIEVPDIDDSFWSEVISMESYTAPMDVSKDGTAAAQFDHSSLRASDSSGDADGVDFWLRVFMEAGDLEDLPEI